ncbi:hypothetical protein D3C77_644340 [compost metagenome]
MLDRMHWRAWQSVGRTSQSSPFQCPQGFQYLLAFSVLAYLQYLLVSDLPYAVQPEAVQPEAVQPYTVNPEAVIQTPGK